MFQFEVDGYQYIVERDDEYDNIKNYHYCYKDGVEVKMPDAFYRTSPYTWLTKEQFTKHIRTLEVFVQG
jgi:hypothetical protein